MREILFRGETEKGEWVQGDLLIKGFDYETAIRKLYEENNMLHGSIIKVIPETIGQYTGLTDKNGTKIFEGDVVQHPIGTFIVKFSNGTFLSSLTETNYLTFLCSIHNQSKVIGNIHDNPKLLESEVQGE